MAEVIHIRDRRGTRQRTHRRAADHQSIERALDLMRQNLAWVAERLQTAPAAEQAELLERIEKLVATIRYGMLILGEPAARAAEDNFDRLR